MKIFKLIQSNLKQLKKDIRNIINVMIIMIILVKNVWKFAVLKICLFINFQFHFLNKWVKLLKCFIKLLLRMVVLRNIMSRLKIVILKIMQLMNHCFFIKQMNIKNHSKYSIWLGISNQIKEYQFIMIIYQKNIWYMI